MSEEGLFQTKEACDKRQNEERHQARDEIAFS
jgi:hypothetical protein